MLIKRDGKILEDVLRTRGVNLRHLAQVLQIEREKLNILFKSIHLEKDIIHLIGITINHDFSKEFPNLFTAHDFLNHRFRDGGGSDSQCSSNNPFN
jgi:hypothetical protein